MVRKICCFKITENQLQYANQLEEIIERFITLSRPNAEKCLALLAKSQKGKIIHSAALRSELQEQLFGHFFQ